MMNEGRLPEWLFRVASNAENGGGHVSRSLILAHAMNAKVSFSVPLESPYRDLIEREGFGVISPEQESSQYDGIWIDAYQENFGLYRDKTGCLAIIEDHKDLYDAADIYVRPFPGQFKAHAGKTELNGFDYALINNRFFLHPPKPVSEDVATILVFMGRYDSANATAKVLEVLSALDLSAKIHVVMGGNAAHLHAVQNYLKSDFRHKWKLSIDLPDLQEVFSDADLLILSGGVAILEACALGCPAIVLNIAENQKKLSQYISKTGAIAYAGYVSEFNQKDFSGRVIQTLLYKERKDLSKKASGLIGKSGAVEVARILTQNSLKEVA